MFAVPRRRQLQVAPGHPAAVLGLQPELHRAGAEAAAVDRADLEQGQTEDRGRSSARAPPARPDRCRRPAPRPGRPPRRRRTRWRRSGQPNPALPSRATAKIRGCSRMARQISPSPRPSTPVRTGSARSMSGTPYLLCCALPAGLPRQPRHTRGACYMFSKVRPTDSIGRYGRNPTTVLTLSRRPRPCRRLAWSVSGSRRPIGSIRRVTDYAPIERAALADLMAELGPDAPTLCEGWTTRDLAAHLDRARRPGPTRRPASCCAAWPNTPSGCRHRLPPGRGRRCSPRSAGGRGGRVLLDEAVNRNEYFIHHEDVRRAQPGWQPRELPPDFAAALWAGLRTPARLALRRTPAQVTITAPGHGTVVAGRGGPAVDLAGPPGELLLFVTGSPGARAGGAGRPRGDHRADACPPVRTLAQRHASPEVLLRPLAPWGYRGQFGIVAHSRGSMHLDHEAGLFDQHRLNGGVRDPDRIRTGIDVSGYIDSLSTLVTAI